MDKQKILHEMYEQGKFDARANNYIENYKQGFKEGVQAVQIQLKDRLNKRRLCCFDRMKKAKGGKKQYLNGKINEQSCIRVDIEEICKELLEE